MTDPKDVFFKSFKTDKAEYQVSKTKTEIVKFSGEVSMGGFRGHKLLVIITMPDNKEQKLTAALTSSGYFETFFSLDKRSLPGKYKAKATFMQKESDEINFQVTIDTSDLVRKWILFPDPLVKPVSPQIKPDESIPAAVPKIDETHGTIPAANQIDDIQTKFIQTANYLLEGFEESMKTSKSNYQLIIVINIIIVFFGVLLLSFSIYYSWVSQKFELFSAITAGVGVADFMALFLVNPQTKIRKNLADLVQMRMIYTMWISELYSAYFGLTTNGYAPDNIMKYQNSLNVLTKDAVTLIENNIGNDMQSSNDQKK